MTLDDLLAEGEALSRPSYLLGPDGTGLIAGYWGGERADHPNNVPPEATALESIHHIITVAAPLLNDLGIHTPAPVMGFSEVRLKSGGSGCRVLQSGPAMDALKCDGLPLYATPAPSFPPFEALCLYGSDRIEDWLAGMGLRRHEYHAAADDPLAAEYQAAFEDRAPITRSDLTAVIGGWHMIWPDDDFYLPLEMRLAILTLHEAEPWYELWQATGLRNWSVRERIT